MTDHKFTDDDVIKALECCGGQGCKECPFNCNCATCIMTLQDSALSLINRQKAEIERLNAVHADMTESLRLAAEANKDMQAELQRLNKEVDRLSQCVLYHDGIVSDLEKDVFNAKAEAIKEFVNNVVQELWKLNWHYGQLPCSEEDKTIQRAIKECIAVVERNTKVMTEEQTNESQST